MILPHNSCFLPQKGIYYLSLKPAPPGHPSWDMQGGGLPLPLLAFGHFPLTGGIGPAAAAQEGTLRIKGGHTLVRRIERPVFP